MQHKLAWRGCFKCDKNACEHTADDGCIKVEISDTGHASIIKISDNGGGADEDDLKNIFIRFYKSKESSEKSTGIGLAIAKAVVGTAPRGNICRKSGRRLGVEHMPAAYRSKRNYIK